MTTALLSCITCRKFHLHLKTDFKLINRLHFLKKRIYLLWSQRIYYSTCQYFQTNLTTLYYVWRNLGNSYITHIQQKINTIILYLSNFSIIQSFLLYSHRLVYSAKPSLLHHAYKEAIYLSLSNVNCW